MQIQLSLVSRISNLNNTSFTDLQWESRNLFKVLPHIICKLNCLLSEISKVGFVYSSKSEIAMCEISKNYWIISNNNFITYRITKVFTRVPDSTRL